MSRRVVGVALATSVVLGVLPSHADPPPPPQLPMATCDAHITDGPDDGVPTFNVVATISDPPVKDPRGNIPALDIRSITVRVAPTRVLAFLTLAKIPDTFPATDSAYGYIMWFKRGGKYARFEQVYANPAQVQQGLTADSNSKVSVGSGLPGGAALAGVSGGVDKTKNVAYVSVDRTALETDLGEPLANGDELSVITARTYLWEPKSDTSPGVLQRPADSADDVAPDKAVWKVGDDRCFDPSTITTSGVGVQFGDPAAVTATLKDQAGALLANRKVTVTVPGETATRTLTTDATGAVRLALDAAPPAGTYTVRFSYAGDEFSGAGQGSGTLTVRPETIRVAKLAVTKAGATRTVTATLTEDDPRAFARQPVAWYVNGKKVATTLTDAAGRAVFKGAKPGQKVQARYAGVTGRYAAVVSNTTAV